MQTQVLILHLISNQDSNQLPMSNQLAFMSTNYSPNHELTNEIYSIIYSCKIENYSQQHIYCHWTYQIVLSQGCRVHLFVGLFDAKRKVGAWCDDLDSKNVYEYLIRFHLWLFETIWKIKCLPWIYKMLCQRNNIIFVMNTCHVTPSQVNHQQTPGQLVSKAAVACCRSFPIIIW